MNDADTAARLEFFKKLQRVTTRIHATENIDQIMLEPGRTSASCSTADRLTLYAVNEDKRPIVSKVKTGLNTSRDLKLPISAQSIAGYVAQPRKMVNIADVYDEEELKRIHPTLSFLKEVDKRSGYRTKQMLVVPHPGRRQRTARRAAGHQQQERPARSASWKSRAAPSCARRWPPRSASACRSRRQPAPPRDQVRRAGGRRAC